MRIGLSACVASVFSSMLLTSGAFAQGTVFNKQGVQPNRAYQELAPFEHIDTFTGNVILTFTDLVLPGDGGVALEVQRTYNLKAVGEIAMWRIGLADVPMTVRFPDGPPVGHPNPELFFPVLVTNDGAEHPAQPITLLTQGPPASWRTKEFWEYRIADHRLDLPNGLVCYYDAGGSLVRIENKYGIQAQLQWDGAAPPNRALVRIVQHVGGTTRAIDFGADADTWPMPRAMTFGSRQWIYEYEPGSPKLMHTAHQPDGSMWRFEYQSMPTRSIRAVTTPHGGRIAYDIDQHAFEVDQTTLQPIFTQVLKRREVVARPGRDLGGVWVYAYPSVTDPAKITIVEGPSNTRKAYFYNLGSSGQAGLVRIETAEWNGSAYALVEAEDRQYTVKSFVPFGTQRLLMRRAVTRDGRTYETILTYSDANWSDFGQPYRIEERGDFTRVTTRSFEPAFRTPFGQAVYLPHAVTRETLTTNGDTYNKDYGYEAGTGFVVAQLIYGIEHRFERDVFGNVSAEVDGVGKRITHTYAWGVREDTTTLEYTIDRTINDDSTVASERRNNQIISYLYDGLFRRTRVVPPAGRPTLTTFDPGGQWVSVRRQGSAPLFSETTYTLDGFGRAVGERNTLGVNKVYAFDALGRRTSESLPFGDGASPTGTSWSYDALGRVRFKIYADGREKRFSYPNGDVRIVDEQDRPTLQNWEATGDPDNRRLASVTDATGNTFTYSYNALDRLTQVVQPGGTMRTFTYGSASDLLVSETHPEAGTTTYLYDPAGRRRRRTDPANQGFEYHYDGNDRIVHVDAPGTDYDVYFAYDAADNRTMARNAFVRSDFAYDAANRLQQRLDTFVASGLTFVTGYTYTGLDQIARLTYPSGTVIDYGYDREGRLTFVSRAGALVLQVLTHHPSGAPERVRLGNGSEEIRTYSDRHRPSRIDLPGLSLQYEYYDAGSVRRIVDIGRPTMTQAFEYDGLDRLTRHQRGVLDVRYGYDALGNRTSAGGSSIVYDPVTLRDTRFIYGLRGQVVNDVHGAYTYNTWTMLQTAQVNGATTTYRYDADNLRKITIPQNGPQEFAIHGQGPQVLTEGAVSGPAIEWLGDYIYAGAQLVARIRPAPPVTPVAIHVAFSPGSQQVSEAAGGVTATVVVTTSGGQPTPRAFTLAFATAQGSATEGTDYTGAAGSFVVQAGTPHGTTFSALLPLFNDRMDEPNETFQMAISSPDGGATVGAPLAVTIVDDDAPGANIEIDLTLSEQTVNEGAGSVPVSVRVITANGQPTTATVPLNFSTAPGTAAAGADYGHVAGGLPITAGTANGTVIASAIAIVNDAVDEPAETFTLNISTAAPGTSAVPTQTIVIQDDDPGPFGFAASSDGDAEAGAGARKTSTPVGRAAPIGEWTRQGPEAPSTQPLTWMTRPPAQGGATRQQQPEGEGR